MPPKKPKKLAKKPRRKQSVASKLKKLGKAVKKDSKDIGKSVYKRAKNGRVYKLVNKRPRFVSKKEAVANGFSAAKLPSAKPVKTKAKPQKPVTE